MSVSRRLLLPRLNDQVEGCLRRPPDLSEARFPQQGRQLGLIDLRTQRQADLL
jgi:hypothetical protein